MLAFESAISERQLSTAMQEEMHFANHFGFQNVYTFNHFGNPYGAPSPLVLFSATARSTSERIQAQILKPGDV